MSQRDVIYNNLLKQYDLTLDRRKTLNGQAAGLLSFTGIIQTVFLGLLVTLATNSDARTTLLAGQNQTMILNLLALGFVMFMITISLAFLAYFELRWVAAPQVLFDTDPMKWRKKLEAYKADPTKIPHVGYEMQLMRGITDNNKINRIKYWVLVGAYISLGVSLFLLAIVGFYIIAAIA